jgi:transposase
MLWLQRGGVAALCTSRAPGAPLLDADAKVLRALASSEGNHRVAKSLLALAYIAEGSTTHDAAVGVGVTHGTAQTWLAVFRASGVEGLRVSRYGPPGTAKLTDEQRQELAELIKANPAISPSDLWSIVRGRFGATYHMEVLLRLAKELGYQPYKE